ncbi:MAG TPA: hypothetical protein VHC18_18305 [Amycolatopsis sp.]|nr:hypothetical protein [Amycolatopsis sp.]
MNAEIRDPRPDVDRVLVAAQLLDEGHYRAAHLIVDTMLGALSYDLDTIADKLREHQETLDKARLCKDDPRYYRDLHEDWQPYGSLLDYSEWRCAELDTDAAQLLAEIVRLAEEIAAKAERLVAA